MATELTPQQVAEINLLAKRDDPKLVWNRLAEMGDKYAEAAAKVINRPDSFAWSVVRGIWHHTGAEFDKFDLVATTHMQRYVELIGHGRNDGSLPYTNEIETSYVRALERHNQPAHTAIDVAIERVIDRFQVSPPHWYNTPGVMMLEGGRVRPSDRVTLEKIDPEVARTTWGMSGMLAAAIQADKMGLPDAAQNVTLRAQQWVTGHPLNIDRSSTGIHVYINAEQGNWAFYDKAGYGRAHVDGHDYNIDKHNWQKAPDGHHHQILLNGQWKTVQMDAVGPAYSPMPQTTQMAQAPASQPSELQALLQDGGSKMALLHDRVKEAAPHLDETEQARLTAAAGVGMQKKWLDAATLGEVKCGEFRGEPVLFVEDAAKVERLPNSSFCLVNMTKALDTPVQDSLTQMQNIQIAQAQALEQRQSQGGPVMTM